MLVRKHQNTKRGLRLVAVAFAAALATAPAPRPAAAPLPSPPPRAVRASAAREILVTVTAYNSTPAQTDSTPFLAAHNTVLTPGMRVIAVSRDLEAAGLRHGTRVRIEGLPGEWKVADRMARHQRNAIDVYMGLDVVRAREFGKRKLRVSWLAQPPAESA
jgi:3D (Asp-Asp-Asp) domain-containing protein